MSLEKVKLLHLITTFSVGGAEMHLLMLIKNLPKDRFDITVAFFKEEAQEARSLVPDFEAIGVKVVNLAMSGRLDIFALRRLYILMRDGQFDIVHTHLFRSDLFGSLLAKFLRVPKIFCTVHNTEQFFKNTFVKHALRTAYRHVDRIIAISNAVNKSLTDDIAIPEKKIKVIHYGIEIDIEREKQSTFRNDIRKELGIPSEAIVIGTVGRIARQKGHCYLIEAFSHLYRHYPQIQLLIVGHDDEGLRKELESLIESLKLGNAVHLAGYINGKEAMAAMDIFVLPSLWEGFGLVLLEAMQMELPIVATRVGSIPEIIEEGKTGLLTPVDVNKMTDAIRILLENRENAKLMGKAGKRLLDEKFTIPSMVEKIITLYHS